MAERSRLSNTEDACKTGREDQLGFVVDFISVSLLVVPGKPNKSSRLETIYLLWQSNVKCSTYYIPLMS